MRTTEIDSFLESLWRRLTWHLTASTTTARELVKCLSRGIEGRRTNATATYWFQRDVYYCEAVVQGEWWMLFICRPQSKIASIIALYFTHPPTTVALSILFQTQLTEQINMSFVLVVCCVVLHLCGNLPPTSRTDEPPRNHDNSHPKEKASSTKSVLFSFRIIKI